MPQNLPFMNAVRAESRPIDGHPGRGVCELSDAQYSTVALYLPLHVAVAMAAAFNAAMQPAPPAKTYADGKRATYFDGISDGIREAIALLNEWADEADASIDTGRPSGMNVAREVERDLCREAAETLAKRIAPVTHADEAAA